MVLFPYEKSPKKRECSEKRDEKGAKTGEKLCVGKLAKKGLTNKMECDIITYADRKEAKKSVDLPVWRNRQTPGT